MIRSTGLLAPLASFVLPGSGQLLQGRFDVGVRHASLAILLAAVGAAMSAAGTGLAVVILGCWSAYDAWHRRHGKESTTAARSSLTDAATAGAAADAHTVDAAVPPPSRPTQPPGQSVAWWRSGLRVAPLVALQAVAAVEIMFFLVAAALSVMAFDAPGSTERLDAWAFVIGLNLLPLVAAFLCAWAWGLHGRGRTVWAAAILTAVVLGGLAVARLLLGPQRLW
jgi:hypothetical protein